MTDTATSTKKENKTKEVTPSKGDVKDTTPVRKSKKKLKKVVAKGNVYILASYNNTIITVTDLNGDVVSWSTAGSSGFRGARKSTPYAAQVAAESAIDKALNYGLESVNIFVKGVGSGREQSIRGIQGKGVEIISIIDTTPVPHNGCRKKKPRRV